MEENYEYKKHIHSQIDSFLKEILETSSSKVQVEAWEFIQTSKANFESKLFLATRTLKAVVGERDATQNYRDTLVKNIGKKDKELAEKELESTHAAQARHSRQELKSQVSKLESALDASRRELEKAGKEPDKVKEEFFCKIQKLHDRNRKSEGQLKEKDQACNILKLDYDVTIKDSDALKERVERQKGMLKEWKSEYNKLKSQRGQLQYRLPRNLPDLEVWNAAYRKAAEDAKSHAEEVAKEKSELEEKLRVARSERVSDTKTIRSSRDTGKIRRRK